MVDKVDLKKQLKQFYNPSAKAPVFVEIPAMRFLMVEGAGNPNTAQAYADAIEVLYSVSYTVKFMMKLEHGLDYPVMPLEGLWWGTPFGKTRFTEADKDLFQWTAMIMQPDFVTAELMQEGIPATLITDSMAGHFMHRGTIDCVITGADRIAANGDTANKIGTYSLAVLAHENQVPFYIAAPMSTVDISIKSGNDIPIEERKVDEVTAIAGVRVAPDGVAVANPAFDVTPHRYITAIITERGIIRQPYDFD